MKQKCKRSHILWCVTAIFMALFASCESENNYSITGNTGDLGVLTYEWSDALVKNDTVYLICNQNLVSAELFEVKVVSHNAMAPKSREADRGELGFRHMERTEENASAD